MSPAIHLRRSLALCAALCAPACTEDADSGTDVTVDHLALAESYCGLGLLCGDPDGTGNPYNAQAFEDCVQQFQDDDDLFGNSGRLDRLEVMAGCLDAARDCAAFEACATRMADVGPSASSKAGQVCGAEGDEYTECDGDTLLWCFGGEYSTPRYVPFDCTAAGLTCDAGARACVDWGAATCDSGAPDTCEGHAVASCFGGRRAHGDCRRYSTRFTCVPEDRNGEAGCAFAERDPECESFDAVASGCQGDVMWKCSDGGKVKFDCGRLGFACAAGEGRLAECIRR